MSTNYNINLTDNALRKIHSLIEQEKTHDSVLRIAVSGGGCSGFKYNFLIDQVSSLSFNDDDEEEEFEDDDFDEEENDDDYETHSSFSKKYKDIVISDGSGNPLLMIDNCSAKFLKGSVIDYIEDLSGAGFQIKNEVAKSQCGCGNSFSV